MEEWATIGWIVLIFSAMFAMTMLRRQSNEEMARADFSWKHYAKPTPKNLLGLAAAMRRLVAVVAGTSIVLEANMWVSLGVIMLGAVLDELKNFFSMVDDEVRTESVTAEFPSGEAVTVTHEKPNESDPDN
jgi:hypothetical protein